MAISQASGTNDLAADTVIGFVLVTGMSLALITIVMLQGGPALQEVQDRQQLESMVGNYHRLNRAVTTLLSGAPAGTTPAWQVSMSNGALSVDDGGQYVWAYVLTTQRGDDDYQFWFGNFADGDNEISINNPSGAHNFGSDEFSITAVQWNADQEATSQEIRSSSFSTGSDKTLTLNWNLAGNSIQLKIFDRAFDADKPVAHAWFVDTGSVTYRLAGATPKRVLYQNTGIITEIDDGEVMHNSPRLRAPEDQGTSGEDVFVRFVKISGSVALGGRTSGELLLSSEGSHSRASSNDAQRVQIYPATRTMDAWERLLTDENRDYTFEKEADPGGFGTDEQAFYRDTDDPSHGISGDLSTTFVETDIQMRHG